MDEKNTVTKYDTKKVIRMIIFGSAITIFILTLIISLNDFEGIVDVIKTTDVKYLMLAILLLVVYLALYPVTTCILTRTKKCDISTTNTYLIGSTEHFFNGITPFATGGQPFQVYAFKRLGVSLADSTGILMMNFIIHMMVTNLYALISLFYYPQLSANISNLNVMVIIGFSINFFVLLFLISVATTKKVREILEKAMLGLCKIKFLRKFIEPNIDKFNDYCYGAQSAFKELWKHKGAFCSCFVIRFITMGIYYAITFYILKALHINIGIESLPFVIFSTAFAITMCVFIPTPGSSGGIEFAFKSIFQSIAVGITSSIAMGGMLLWRLLSYYLAMVLSFFIYLILEKITLNKENEIKNIIPQVNKKVNDINSSINSKICHKHIQEESNENVESVQNSDVINENKCVVANENNEIDINETQSIDCDKKENIDSSKSLDNVESFDNLSNAKNSKSNEDITKLDANESNK